MHAPKVSRVVAIPLPMKTMNKRAEELMQKTEPREMFSIAGWARVMRASKGVYAFSPEKKMADAFIEFQQIFYEDNMLDDSDFTHEEAVKLEVWLMDIFVTYLLWKNSLPLLEV